MTAFAEVPASFVGPWRLLLPLVAAAAGVFLLLPRPRNRAALWGAVCGVVGLVSAGWLLFRTDNAPAVESFLFFAFSALAVLGGGLMITQRNPARAALSFAVVVMNVCGLFLLQAAPFLMAATIIIYAGAIIVTFLFVLMLAQQTGFSDADDRSREPFLASFSGFVMLGALLLLLDHSFPDPKPFSELLDRLATAKARESADEMRSVLGDPVELYARLEREGRHVRGTPYDGDWKDGAEDLREALSNRTTTAATLRDRIERLLRAGRESRARLPLPAANVAGLGRLLFSDYLLAVELGGTLLLVATIGAIAITHRRERRPA
ncbi:MAG: NADH-quinone oxidoreductase subunit J [Gemmataceae bacterium]